MKLTKAQDMARRHRERMDLAIRSLGGKCAFCGETENLQLDHIDPTLKKAAVSVISKARWEIFWAEVEKCQLLCTPCHKTKTSSEKTWTHGTIFGFQKKKCQCEDCQKVKNDYNAVRRLKRGSNRPARSSVRSCGTYASYKAGCRCQACRSANSIYMQELRAKKRQAN